MRIEASQNKKCFPEGAFRACQTIGKVRVQLYNGTFSKSGDDDDNDYVVQGVRSLARVFTHP